MKAQLITDGVLVRPFESAATRFISTRFYDGRRVIDLLESAESACHWFAVMSDQLSVAPVATVREDQLDKLRQLRDQLINIYNLVLSGDTASAEKALDQILTGIQFSPVAYRVGTRLQVDLTGHRDSVDSAIAEVVISAAETVTPPELLRLRKCEGPNCVLFYTQFREGQNWCSGTCGNRARVARHARK